MIKLSSLIFSKLNDASLPWTSWALLKWWWWKARSSSKDFIADSVCW
jgi:hypothetical protein